MERYDVRSRALVAAPSYKMSEAGWMVMRRPLLRRFLVPRSIGKQPQIILPFGGGGNVRCQRR